MSILVFVLWPLVPLLVICSADEGSVSLLMDDLPVSILFFAMGPLVLLLLFLPDKE